MHPIPLDHIDPNPAQPRRHAGDLDSLAASIADVGVLHPIIVRLIDSTREHPRYQIIDGERRWRAARLAGLTEIPAIVQAHDDEQAMIRTVVSNLQRKDLSPLEEARAYEHLQRYGLTQERIGRLVGRSQPTIAQKLSLLRLMPPVQFFFETGALSETMARELLQLENLDCGQGRSFQLGSPDLRVLDPKTRKPQRWDPRAPYQGPQGVARLLMGLMPNGAEERELARLLARSHQIVQDACALYLDYYPGNNARWQDLAFFFACCAVQLQWTRDTLSQTIKGTEHVHHQYQAVYARERAAMKDEPPTDSSRHTSPSTPATATGQPADLSDRVRSVLAASGIITRWRRDLARRDPETLGAVLGRHDRERGEAFLAECRDWLARLDAAMHSIAPDAPGLRRNDETHRDDRGNTRTLETTPETQGNAFSEGSIR